MSITTVTKHRREHTGIEFYFSGAAAETPEHTALREAYLASGDLVITIALSEDLLEQTVTTQFASIEILSNYASSMYSAVMRALWLSYNMNGVAYVDYEISGLASPFIHKTTYIFPSASDQVTSILGGLSDNMAGKRTPESLIVTENSLTLAYKYADSNEYNTYNNQDRLLVNMEQTTAMISEGVVKTVTYTLV